MSLAPFDALLAEFAAAVDEHARALLDEAALPGQLDGMLRYHLGWVDERFQPVSFGGGKRVRPALVLLACEAAGAAWRTALPSATAVELVHNFSLIHDDIEDRSSLRRHRPTLWARWGDARAINAGDALFALAQMAALAQPPGAADGAAAARLLNEATARLCAGQQRDLEQMGGAAPTLEDYYAMIEGKTAALLAVAAELGALAAGSPAAVRACYGRFGREIGLAFQLQDDLLDVWGSTDSLGKAAREDLRAGKHSLPVVLARAAAPAPLADRLRALYEQPPPLSDDSIDALVALFDGLGVAAEGERRVRGHHAAAFASLHEARPRAEPAARLTALADRLIGREA
jgi:geranylgeranyl diphosphate synthase, type I